ncbi:hypothetical protein EOL70_10990 [Leucothrix sargassi]|nr:hypothetical protein EOL70_10990 [Leucothrix sargassi]
MTQIENKIPENCLLCDEKNHCANLSPSTSCEKCWCMKDDIKFPESLLARVSDSDKNKSCICKACAAKHCSQQNKS